MNTNQRYLIAHRVRFPAQTKHFGALETVLAHSQSARAIRQTPSGRRVASMTAREANALARQSPHLIVEEDQPLILHPMPDVPTLYSGEAKFMLRVNVQDKATGQGVPDVTIFGLSGELAYKAQTNAQGVAQLATASAALDRIIVSPRDRYWSQVVDDVSLGVTPEITIPLERLPLDGGWTWGHRILGFDQVTRCWTGRGVRIGVIDSGIASDLSDLHPFGGCNTLDGQDFRRWDIDEKGHGTHCAGIVAAKHNRVGITGGAFGSEVYSIKVFPSGFISDLVEAVDWCIANRMDVINMSLGSPHPSQLLADALAQADACGIVCVAAAGNDSTHVSFPAVLETVIAVSAIGRVGTFPLDSGHALRLTDRTDWRGELFSASFNNFGLEVDVCAPGVAIVSTVPTGYAAWDGTSMACPFISALVALLLEACPRLRTGDAWQTECVRRLLRAAALPLGLSPLLQGAGLPSMPRLLSAAARFL